MVVHLCVVSCGHGALQELHVGCIPSAGASAAGSHEVILERASAVGMIPYQPFKGAAEATNLLNLVSKELEDQQEVKRAPAS